MSNTTKLPTLYALSSTGKIKVIDYSVVLDEFGVISINNEHGYINGKKQLDKTVVSVGKNIGRANATTPHEQAIKEMNAKWTAKKLKKNYTENESGIPDTIEKSLLPMLAHKFTERKHNIKYKCIIEPKFNGVRCLVRIVGDKVSYGSRGGKNYITLGHLDNDIKTFIGDSDSNIILDGEIYVHGMTLQEINRRVKKFRGADTLELKYYVYDIIDPNNQLTNRKRKSLMRTMFAGRNINNIVPVYGTIAYNEQDVYDYHNTYVQQGYEGIIIRNLDGLYKFGHRSQDLQKYKSFDDNEFEIIDTTSGEGREELAIIFICKVNNPLNGHDGVFSVRPKGTIESRRSTMLDSSTNYIGQLLTVRHFGFSEDNIPIFPVGVTVRLNQDLP